MSLAQILFSPKGRIPRSTFWYYILCTIGIYIVALVIDFGLSDFMDSEEFVGCVTGITSIAILITSIFVTMKRCHDCNHSGWMVLLAIVPIASWWLVIETCFIKGTEGENRFGADPLKKEMIGVPSMQ